MTNKHRKLIVAACALGTLALVGLLPDETGTESTMADVYARQDAQLSYKRSDLGDTVKPRPGYLTACMPTEDGLSEVVKWQVAGDQGEMGRSLLNRGGTVVTSDDRLKVLDVGFAKTKVRVSGGAECYVVSELTFRRR